MPDSGTLGSLNVNLGLSTVSFEQGTTKAQKLALQNAEEIRKQYGALGNVFNPFINGIGTLEASMTESRHSVMELGQLMGAHIPRAVSTLVASIGVLQPLLTFAFPIIGAVALFEVVTKLIEKHEALAEAARKMAHETADLAIKEEDRTRGLELENLKLDDQIAKLEGRPSTNKLAEAILETKIKANELAAALDQVQQKSQQVFEKQLTFADRLFDQFKTLKDLAQGIIADITPFGEGMNKLLGTDNVLFGGKSDLSKVRDEVRSVAASYEEVQAAREKLNLAKGTEDEQDAINALSEAYKKYGETAQSALVVTRTLTPNNIELMHALKDATISATSGINDMGEEVKNAQKKIELGQKETAKEIADQAKENANATAQAAKRSGDAEVAIAEATAKELYATRQISADDEAHLLDDLESRKHEINVKAIEDEKAALSNSPKDKNRLKALNADLEVEEARHQQAMLGFATDRYKRDEEEQNKLIEAHRRLMSAEEALTRSQTKLDEEINKQHETEQEEAIKRLVAMRVITEREGNAQLDALHQDELNNHLALLKDQLAKEQADLETAKAQQLEVEKSGDEAKILEAQAYVDKLKAILNGTQAEIIKAQTEADKQQMAIWEKNAKEVEKVWDKVTGDFTRSLNSAIIDGKNTWKSFFQDLERMALEFIEKQLFNKIFASVFGGSGGGGFFSGLLGSIGSLFGLGGAAGAAGSLGANDLGGAGLAGFSGLDVGFAADGAFVEPGKAYVVGERHPELFIPGVSGAVIPEVTVGGRGTGEQRITTPIINFHGVQDMDTFRRSASQVGASIQRDMYMAHLRNN
jgi:hypothetical protein